MFGGDGNLQMQIYVNGSYAASTTGNDTSYTIPANATSVYARLRFGSGQVFNNLTVKPMVSPAAISAFSPPNSNADTVSISWQSTAGTVYGGTLDVTTGELTVTHMYRTLNGTGWTRTGSGIFYKTYSDLALDTYGVEGVCSAYKATYPAYLSADKQIVFGSSNFSATPRILIRDDAYADATAFGNYLDGLADPVQVVYKLATPTTYTITPEQVETLLGVNNIWADCGNITVEYGDDPGKLLNPTLMPARPLIRVYGYGTLVVGNVTVTISNYSLSYIDIDCAMMDCYSGSTNLNSYVTFSGNDFPVLGPGATSISYSGSITKVLITTNWWRV